MKKKPVKNQYVLGFIFDVELSLVLLIRKAGRRFGWQSGKLNGVGGKMLPGETPAIAMRRECAEEVGTALGVNLNWNPYCTLSFKKDEVFCFCGVTHLNFATIKTPPGADEPLVVVNALNPPLACIYNTGWLIAMGREHLRRNLHLQYTVHE
jgi:8-oxo-dGTP diphosphatase